MSLYFINLFINHTINLFINHTFYLIRLSQGAQSGASLSKPLCNDLVLVSSQGSTHPWLAGANEGRQSGAINFEDASGAQTSPKPDLISEIRGPGGVAAATIQIFNKDKTSWAPRQPQKSSKCPGWMVLKACEIFEKFFEFKGEAYEEWIDEHSLEVPGWAKANVEDFGDIQRRKEQRESNSLIGAR